MRDRDLLNLLVNLAKTIHALPAGAQREAIVDQFFAVVASLESRDLIDRSGEWYLTSRPSD